MTVEKKTSSIKSLQKAMDILRILSSEMSEISLHELSETLDLPKATVHRIIVTLERGGLVEQNASNSKYRLGLKILGMANKVLDRLNIRNEAREPLEHLVQETGECAYLAVLNQGQVIYIDKVENKRFFSLNTDIGNCAPVHSSALGKVLVAYLADNEREAILTVSSFNRLHRFTSNTISSIDKLRQELNKIIENGYAVDDEEFEEGLFCLAVPVRNHLGRVIASISLAGPSSRMKASKLNFIEQLLKTGEVISNRLGHF